MIDHPANPRYNSRFRSQNGLKKIVGYIKLQVPAGKANPSPRSVPLSVSGLNIMEFCKAFNAQTRVSSRACRFPW